MTTNSPRICSQCEVPVPHGHQFCGQCGGTEFLASVESKSLDTLFYGSLQTPGRAKLVLISGETVEGVSYHLTGTEHLVGNQNGDIPFQDSFISPSHATFFYHENKLFLQDMDSLNGTYLRAREDSLIQDGDMILAGHRYFLFEDLNVASEIFAEDETRYHLSPTEGITFRLSEVLEGGLQGRAHTSPQQEILVGREGCDLSFPNDVHISRKHFKIQRKGEQTTIFDLGSKNGTFVRIRQTIQLQHNDYVFIGKQLLRVELNA